MHGKESSVGWTHTQGSNLSSHHVLGKHQIFVKNQGKLDRDNFEASFLGNPKLGRLPYVNLV